MTPDQIRDRQRACLRLVSDRQSWETLQGIVDGMLGLAAAQNLEETDEKLRPRAYYRGLAEGLRALVAAVAGEAERAKTEGDPGAKEADETVLIADVLAQFSSGGGHLA